MKIISIIIYILIAFCFTGCIDKSSLDAKNWPKIILSGSLNNEKPIYKVGDTITFTFIVPDSLPSLTILNEKNRIFSLEEASILFDFAIFDTITKKISTVNANNIVSSLGNISLKNNSYFTGVFNTSSKPFGIRFSIILKQTGLYYFMTRDILKFIANSGNNKAGLLFNLNLASSNFNFLMKHFNHFSEPDPTLTAYYAFYVQ